MYFQIGWMLEKSWHNLQESCFKIITNYKFGNIHSVFEIHMGQCPETKQLNTVKNVSRSQWQKKLTVITKEVLEHYPAKPL